MKKKLAIVTAADERYLPAACCALLSCVQCGKVKDQAELFLIAHGVLPAQRDAAERFLRNQNVSVAVVDYQPTKRMYRVDGWISLAAYARLDLDELFDASWSRILY